MLNYWWVTRPKRKLNSVPETLAAIAKTSLDQEWQGQRGTHLQLEEELEKCGLKREGERRDHTGGGGRTYMAWLLSLGLIFTQKSTGKMKLTLAGEALMKGDSPVDVLKDQVLKYQFPSTYSLKRNVSVNLRFKIHPFVFLFRLLADKRIDSLSQEEVAKIVVTEAENETDACFEYIVQRLLEFRERGDACLAPDFAEKYAPSKDSKRGPFQHLMEVANTIFNWMEYTQLARRDAGRMEILPEKRNEVEAILTHPPAFIDRPACEEYFQRKYGVDPKHNKDTRNLTASKTITAKILAVQAVKTAFITISLKRPIAQITADLIAEIVESTGIIEKAVEEILLECYPRGAVGAFMTEYFEMAFKGREEATDFEKATSNIFRDVFGFETKHVGPIGLTPDVLVLSAPDANCAGYAAIIDNKAYSKYTISNDHRNRMIHNYIANMRTYYEGTYPLAFFSYISGGFGKSIGGQIQSITDETGIRGSAVNVNTVIELVKRYEERQYDHSMIREVFSVGRQASLADLDSIEQAHARSAYPASNAVSSIAAEIPHEYGK